MMRNDPKMNEFGAALRNIQASNKNLENEIGQLAWANIERLQGSLLTNTKRNLREHVNAITL